MHSTFGICSLWHSRMKRSLPSGKRKKCPKQLSYCIAIFVTLFVSNYSHFTTSMPYAQLELIELSRRTSSRGRKVKEWARKAIAKAEIDSCWRKKTWKAAAYVRKCRRWTNPWWFPTGWCSGGYYCNGRDREVLGLCHQGELVSSFFSA